MIKTDGIRTIAHPGRTMVPRRVETEIRRELVGMTHGQLVERVIRVTEERDELQRRLSAIAALEDGSL